MKRPLFILIIGFFLFSGCIGTITEPPIESPSDAEPTEQPSVIPTTAPTPSLTPIVTEKKTYTLAVSVSPLKAGSVSPPSGKYEEGTELTLKAVPANGYSFDYWEGDFSDSIDTITIIMDSDKKAIANFKQIDYELRISVVGGGRTWPSAGRHSYRAGTEVELLAIPDEGRDFKGWSGDINNDSASTKLVMDGNKSITANFLDKSPPKILSVMVTDITDCKATIKWETDEASTSQIEYGMTPDYGLTTALDEKLATSHALALTALTPGKTYHFKVKSVDDVGNEAISVDNTFTTAVVPVSTKDTSVAPIAFLEFNKPYLAENGLTVTVHGITVVQKSGFKEYTISYTLKNNTPDQAIVEGTFKIFFKSGGGEPQYGFFSRLFPGESMNRSYTWKVLNAQEVLCIEFESDFFSKTPSPNTLKWLW